MNFQGKKWNEFKILIIIESGGIIMNITTRQGDYGVTDIHGKRISKTDLLMEVIGEIDTLMAQCIICSAQDDTYRTDMMQIVEDLTTMCSYITDYTPEVDFTVHLSWITDRIRALEPKEMNFQFVYSFTSIKAAQYNLARTFARTAERKCFMLAEKRSLDANALKYMNRLSDLFFIMTVKSYDK